MDELKNVYDKMLTESAKQDMTVGNVKKNKDGELDGPVNKMGPKDSGPDNVDDVKKADEAPKSLSPVSKKKLNKENVDMNNANKSSFQDLYNQVINEAEDLESPAYSDETGDFPPAEGEIGPEGDVAPGTEDQPEGEMDDYSKMADLFSQMAEIFLKLSGKSMDLPAEEGPAEEAPMGEAVSEPAPKPFNANIKQLQAPKKLGGVGVKTVKGKADTSAGAKKRTGEMDKAPTGVKPGDKSFMKVGGSGPAASAKNASMLEN